MRGPRAIRRRPAKSQLHVALSPNTNLIMPTQAPVLLRQKELAVRLNDEVYNQSPSSNGPQSK